jgi:hypothetical protein
MLQQALEMLLMPKVTGRLRAGHVAWEYHAATDFAGAAG